jgi:hypothetical protein
VAKQDDRSWREFFSDCREVVLTALALSVVANCVLMLARWAVGVLNG